MTVREIYESVLVEINKENAPTFTIEEFNYMLNKAVLALTNEKYNFYSANQQLSDDLRVLTKPVVFNVGGTTTTYNPIRSYAVLGYSAGTTVIRVSSLADLVVGSSIQFDGNNTAYYVTDMNEAYPYTMTIGTPLVATLPAGTSIKVQTPVAAIVPGLTTDRIISVTLPSSDYLHMLSCRVLWQGSKSLQDTPTYLIFPAKRLTFDMLNFIENNTYMRPAANRPYYHVFDNQMNSGNVKLPGDQGVYGAYQNKPRVDIHIGRSRVAMEAIRIEMDYLKLPEPVILDDIDIFTAGADTSQALEFPDYLKNEIVRRVSAYLLEKIGDPRIQTQPQLNQEIPAVPLNMQQQAQPQPQQQGR